MIKNIGGVLGQAVGKRRVYLRSKVGWEGRLALDMPIATLAE
jgi:hypothetical protein